MKTAVPAFIGYTPCAGYQGKSYYNKPTQIFSPAQFQTIYLLPDPPPANPARQYQPFYYMVAQDGQPTAGTHIAIDGVYYSILPDPNMIYYVSNSIRLFFQNGGASAYIVAVGTYGSPTGKAWPSPDTAIINPNVLLTDLQRGLSYLKSETEPTMYLCPEATLLSLGDNAILMQDMLLQAQTMQTAVCLFDVIGGGNPDPATYTTDQQ